MFYVRHGDRYVIRFEEGELFPDRFLEFLAANAIGGGSFTGIGAMSRSTIAFFDIEKKQYLDRELDEQMEVLAVVGNVAIHNDEPLVHAHITLGRKDYSVLGGHLLSGVVRPTLEIILRPEANTLERAVDPKYGLPTLDLKERL
jgi:predicted DNA-binding protein with PD1-like motif